MTRRKQVDEAEAQRIVDAFNRENPVGSPVTVRRDGGQTVDTTVHAPAEIVGGTPVGWFHGIAGCYMLERVTPRRVEPGVPDPHRPFRRGDDWRAQRDLLMVAVPEYYHEAQALYPGMLPPKTEELDDLWRNRTTAENAVWLIGCLRDKVQAEQSGMGQMRLIVEGFAAQGGWDGNERRRGERRAGAAPESEA
jgi:hypothetical protein